MQETKTIDDNFPSLDFKQKQYNVIFIGQKSYNGVAIASKFEINEISRSLPMYDDEINENDQARFLHVKINDINISTLDQLITILRNKRAGDAITVEILRGGNTITLDFTLDLRPSDV